MAIPEDAEAARLQKERQNFLRRKSYAEKSVNTMKEECARMLADAKDKVSQVLEEGRQREAAQLKVSQDLERKQQAIQVAIHEKEAQLESLNLQTVNLHSSGVGVPRSDSLQQRRLKDAARKRAAYWEDRQFNKRATNSAGSDGTESVELIPNRSRRSVDALVTEVIKDLFKRMEHFNYGARKLVFNRLWLHSGLRAYQPTSFGCPSIDVSMGAAVQDLRQTLHIIKFAKRRDHLGTKQALLTAMTGQAVVSSRYQSSLARAMGMKRQNFHKHSKKRQLIDADRSIRYPLGDRKQRSDVISPEVRKVVVQFWEMNTRISPNKKDHVRHKLSPKTYTDHHVHWLEDTEVDFYLRFRDFCALEKNGVQIGLRKFQEFKPYYVRTMKDRNVCCCKYHVEMDLFKEAINRFRKHHHPKVCSCDCSTCTSPDFPVLGQSCGASKNYINSVRGWMEGAVCPRLEGQQWHKKSCILGQCDKCGVHKIQWCPMELDPAECLTIAYKAFEYKEVDLKAKLKAQVKSGADESDRRTKTRLTMVEKTDTPLPEFREAVLLKMRKFLVHNFAARWQGDQHQLCMKTFPRGVVVSSIDYSENYTFKVQNEIQTLHWNNTQVTLLILVTYRHREDVQTVEAAVGRTVELARASADDDRDVVADYHFYISDDNEHDTLFVQHCMDAQFQWMTDQGIQFKQHWVWSDGAASQFKGCRPFYYVSRYFKKTGVRMKWFFHATGHGKGVADALGGHVKSAIEKEQLKGTHGYRLESASDVVEFCKNKFAIGQEKEYGDVQLVRRLFWEIPKGAVNRRKKWACDRLNGSRDLHCFDGFSNRLSTLLQVREYACFCTSCIDDDVTHCQNLEWVGNFKLEMVKGVLPSDVRPDVQSMGVGEGALDHTDGALAHLVELGDYYAIEAAQPNDWEVEFYICQCEQVLHTLEKPLVDGYLQSFEKGDEVLVGRWYQPVQGRETSYLYHGKAPLSYAHPRSVIHIKFGLTPCEAGIGATRTFSLDEDTLNAITSSII